MTESVNPYPDKLSFQEKIQLYLFDEPEKIPKWHEFSEHELIVKHRYSQIFTFWIDKPTLSEKKIINYAVNHLQISRTQAYRDIQQVKVLLGNVQNATKEWQRFKVISMLDRAFEIAEFKKNSKDMILAANTLGKYTQLDKEDIQAIPYDEIVPQNFEITGDVTVMGLPPIADLEAKQKKMREKYGGSLIEDAQILDEKNK